MVERVEKVRPKLHGLRFSGLENLGQRHVPIVLSGAQNDAQANIAESGPRSKIPPLGGAQKTPWALPFK